MFEIKYRVHEPGRCEKCGKDCEKLFNVVVSSDDKSRECVLCNVCAHDLKVNIDKKNAEQTNSAPKYDYTVGNKCRTIDLSDNPPGI